MTNEYVPMPDHPKHRFSGQYIGIVETGKHDKYMQVQVRVKNIFTDDVAADDLPWATYLWPVGSRFNEGMFTPVQKDDKVWVDFPFDGDTRRPRIVGSVHYAPKHNSNNTPHAPHESFDGPLKCEPDRTGNEDLIDQSRLATGVPCVYKQHGICIELLDNNDSQSGVVRITSIGSGSNIEIDKNGSIIIHAKKNLMLSARENQETAIHGDSSATILGDAARLAMGNIEEISRGTYDVAGTTGVHIVSAAMVTITAPIVEIN